MRILRGMVALLVILLCSVSVPAQKKKKLKLPEVLEGHLASLGAAEKVAGVKSLRAEGKGRLVVLVGDGRVLEGSSMLTSSALNFRSQIQFAVSDFPGEDVAFDGKESYVAQLQAGRRSELGDFLYQYKTILEEGILGGVATTAWPLHDVKGRRARLRYRGLKKMYDTQLHEVEYRPRRGGSSIEISLFFDAESFQHVATLCRVEIPDAPSMSGLSGTGSERANNSSSGVSTRYLLEERFGDYRDIDGLMLPHVRRVRLTRQGKAEDVGLFTAASRDRSMLEWQMEYETWELNPEVSAEHFKIY